MRRRRTLTACIPLNQVKRRRNISQKKKKIKKGEEIYRERETEEEREGVGGWGRDRQTGTDNQTQTERERDRKMSARDRHAVTKTHNTTAQKKRRAQTSLGRGCGGAPLGVRHKSGG